MTYAVGDKYSRTTYTGNWDKDKKQGEGTMMFINGGMNKGTFKNDKLCTGTSDVHGHKVVVNGKVVKERRRLGVLPDYPTIRGHSGRRLEELTGYSTISRIIREEERSRRTSNLPPRV